ncbi:MAG: hypothetical protein JWM27_3722 [Gemmatimonadetes bacterium]|nr:hypothetical protein [Gemmatimonadota bacterium]
MKKLTLELESLSVESFDTTVAGQDGRGTVHGQAYTVYPQLSCGFTCGAQPRAEGLDIIKTQACCV